MFFYNIKSSYISLIVDKPASQTIPLIPPLSFCLTTANVYDNQVSELLYEVKIYNPFVILADAAYDDTTWFETAKDLSLNF